MSLYLQVKWIPWKIHATWQRQFRNVKPRGECSCVVKVVRNWWPNGLGWRRVEIWNLIHTNVIHFRCPQAVLNKLSLKCHNRIFHGPKRVRLVKSNPWLFPLEHLFNGNNDFLLYFIYLKIILIAFEWLRPLVLHKYLNFSKFE